ncbi:MAG: hypothetical protein ACI8Z9_002270 [Paraglaciecola sp.]|jgi:hypothetical protein
MLFLADLGGEFSVDRCKLYPNHLHLESLVYIPVVLEALALLAALTHLYCLKHLNLVQLSSWSRFPLPPNCNSNDFGYRLNF